nr:polyprotein [Betaendornavirus sp.]
MQHNNQHNNANAINNSNDNQTAKSFTLNYPPKGGQCPEGPQNIETNINNMAPIAAAISSSMPIMACSTPNGPNKGQNVGVSLDTDCSTTCGILKNSTMADVQPVDDRPQLTSSGPVTSVKHFRHASDEHKAKFSEFKINKVNGKIKKIESKPKPPTPTIPNQVDAKTVVGGEGDCWNKLRFYDQWQKQVKLGKTKMNLEAAAALASNTLRADGATQSLILNNMQLQEQIDEIKNKLPHTLCGIISKTFDAGCFYETPESKSAKFFSDGYSDYFYIKINYINNVYCHLEDCTVDTDPTKKAFYINNGYETLTDINDRLFDIPVEIEPWTTPMAPIPAPYTLEPGYDKLNIGQKSLKQVAYNKQEAAKLGISVAEYRARLANSQLLDHYNDLKSKYEEFKNVYTETLLACSVSSSDDIESVANDDEFKKYIVDLNKKKRLQSFTPAPLVKVLNTLVANEENDDAKSKHIETQGTEPNEPQTSHKHKTPDELIKDCTDLMIGVNFGNSLKSKLASAIGLTAKQMENVSEHSNVVVKRDNDLIAKAYVKSKYATILLPHNTSEKTMIRLQDEFGEFDIIPGRSEYHQHPYHSTSRKCITLLITRQFPSNTPVFDIGGNFPVHLSFGHYNVHSCFRTNNPYETAGYTDRVVRLAKVVATKYANYKEFQNQQNKSSATVEDTDNLQLANENSYIMVNNLLTSHAYFCDKAAQDCHAAPKRGISFGMSIDTLFYVKPHELGVIYAKKRIIKATHALLVPPGFELLTGGKLAEGEGSWKKIDNMLYTTFNGVSQPYINDIETLSFYLYTPIISYGKFIVYSKIDCSIGSYVLINHFVMPFAKLSKAYNEVCLHTTFIPGKIVMNVPVIDVHSPISLAGRQPFKMTPMLIDIKFIEELKNRLSLPGADWNDLITFAGNLIGTVHWTSAGSNKKWDLTSTEVKNHAILAYLFYNREMEGFRPLIDLAGRQVHWDKWHIHVLNSIKNTLTSIVKDLDPTASEMLNDFISSMSKDEMEPSKVTSEMLDTYKQMDAQLNVSDNTSIALSNLVEYNLSDCPDAPDINTLIENLHLKYHDGKNVTVHINKMLTSALDIRPMYCNKSEKCPHDHLMPHLHRFNVNEYELNECSCCGINSDTTGTLCYLCRTDWPCRNASSTCKHTHKSLSEHCCGVPSCKHGMAHRQKTCSCCNIASRHDPCYACLEEQSSDSSNDDEVHENYDIKNDTDEESDSESSTSGVFDTKPKPKHGKHDNKEGPKVYRNPDGVKVRSVEKPCVAALGGHIHTCGRCKQQYWHDHKYKHDKHPEFVGDCPHCEGSAKSKPWPFTPKPKSTDGEANAQVIDSVKRERGLSKNIKDDYHVHTCKSCGDKYYHSHYYTKDDHHIIDNECPHCSNSDIDGVKGTVKDESVSSRAVTKLIKGYHSHTCGHCKQNYIHAHDEYQNAEHSHGIEFCPFCMDQKTALYHVTLAPTDAYNEVYKSVSNLCLLLNQQSNTMEFMLCLVKKSFGELALDEYYLSSCYHVYHNQFTNKNPLLQDLLDVIVNLFKTIDSPPIDIEADYKRIETTDLTNNQFLKSYGMRTHRLEPNRVGTNLTAKWRETYNLPMYDPTSHAPPSLPQTPSDDSHINDWSAAATHETPTDAPTVLQGTGTSEPLAPQQPTPKPETEITDQEESSTVEKPSIQLDRDHMGHGTASEPHQDVESETDNQSTVSVDKNDTNEGDDRSDADYDTWRDADQDDDSDYEVMPGITMSLGFSQMKPTLTKLKIKPNQAVENVFKSKWFGYKDNTGEGDCGLLALSDIFGSDLINNYRNCLSKEQSEWWGMDEFVIFCNVCHVNLLLAIDHYKVVLICGDMQSVSHGSIIRTKLFGGEDHWVAATADIIEINANQTFNQINRILMNSNALAQTNKSIKGLMPGVSEEIIQHHINCFKHTDKLELAVRLGGRISDNGLVHNSAKFSNKLNDYIKKDGKLTIFKHPTGWGKTTSLPIHFKGKDITLLTPSRSTIIGSYEYIGKTYNVTVTGRAHAKDFGYPSVKYKQVEYMTKDGPKTKNTLQLGQYHMVTVDSAYEALQHGYPQYLNRLVFLDELHAMSPKYYYVVSKLKSVYAVMSATIDKHLSTDTKYEVTTKIVNNPSDYITGEDGEFTVVKGQRDGMHLTRQYHDDDDPYMYISGKMISQIDLNTVRRGCVTNAVTTGTTIPKAKVWIDLGERYTVDINVLPVYTAANALNWFSVVTYTYDINEMMQSRGRVGRTQGGVFIGQMPVNDKPLTLSAVIEYCSINKQIALPRDRHADVVTIGKAKMELPDTKDELIDELRNKELDNVDEEAIAAQVEAGEITQKEMDMILELNIEGKAKNLAMATQFAEFLLPRIKTVKELINRANSINNQIVNYDMTNSKLTRDAIGMLTNVKPGVKAKPNTTKKIVRTVKSGTNIFTRQCDKCKELTIDVQQECYGCRFSTSTPSKFMKKYKLHTANTMSPLPLAKTTLMSHDIPKTQDEGSRLDEICFVNTLNTLYISINSCRMAALNWTNKDAGYEQSCHLIPVSSDQSGHFLVNVPKIKTLQHGEIGIIYSEAGAKMTVAYYTGKVAGKHDFSTHPNIKGIMALYKYSNAHTLPTLEMLDKRQVPDVDRFNKRLAMMKIYSGVAGSGKTWHMENEKTMEGLSIVTVQSGMYERFKKRYSTPRHLMTGSYDKSMFLIDEFGLISNTDLWMMSNNKACMAAAGDLNQILPSEDEMGIIASAHFSTYGQIVYDGKVSKRIGEKSAKSIVKVHAGFRSEGVKPFDEGITVINIGALTRENFIGAINGKRVDTILTMNTQTVVMVSNWLSTKNETTNINITSVRRSQGSEWPHVVVLCDGTHVGDLKKILYVAMTRHTNSCTLVCNDFATTQVASIGLTNARGMTMSHRIKLKMATSEKVTAGSAASANVSIDQPAFWQTRGPYYGDYMFNQAINTPLPSDEDEVQGPAITGETTSSHKINPITRWCKSAIEQYKSYARKHPHIIINFKRHEDLSRTWGYGEWDRSRENSDDTYGGTVQNLVHGEICEWSGFSMLEHDRYLAFEELGQLGSSNIIANLLKPFMNKKIEYKPLPFVRFNPRGVRVLSMSNESALNIIRLAMSDGSIDHSDIAINACLKNVQTLRVLGLIDSVTAMTVLSFNLMACGIMLEVNNENDTMVIDTCDYKLIDNDTLQRIPTRIEMNFTQFILNGTLFKTMLEREGHNTYMRYCGMIYEFINVDSISGRTIASPHGTMDEFSARNAQLFNYTIKATTEGFVSGDMTIYGERYLLRFITQAGRDVSKLIIAGYDAIVEYVMKLGAKAVELLKMLAVHAASAFKWIVHGISSSVTYTADFIRYVKSLYQRSAMIVTSICHDTNITNMLNNISDGLEQNQTHTDMMENNNVTDNNDYLNIVNNDGSTSSYPLSVEVALNSDFTCQRTTNILARLILGELDYAKLDAHDKLIINKLIAVMFANLNSFTVNEGWVPCDSDVSTALIVNDGWLSSLCHAQSAVNGETLDPKLVENVLNNLNEMNVTFNEVSLATRNDLFSINNFMYIYSSLPSEFFLNIDDETMVKLHDKYTKCMIVNNLYNPYLSMSETTTLLTDEEITDMNVKISLIVNIKRDLNQGEIARFNVDMEPINTIYEELMTCGFKNDIGLIKFNTLTRIIMKLKSYCNNSKLQDILTACKSQFGNAMGIMAGCIQYVWEGKQHVIDHIVNTFKTKPHALITLFNAMCDAIINSVNNGLSILTKAMKQMGRVRINALSYLEFARLSNKTMETEYTGLNVCEYRDTTLMKQLMASDIDIDKYNENLNYINSLCEEIGLPIAMKRHIAASRMLSKLGIKNTTINDITKGLGELHNWCINNDDPSLKSMDEHEPIIQMSNLYMHSNQVNSGKIRCLVATMMTDDIEHEFNGHEIELNFVATHKQFMKTTSLDDMSMECYSDYVDYIKSKKHLVLTRWILTNSNKLASKISEIMTYASNKLGKLLKWLVEHTQTWVSNIQSALQLVYNFLKADEDELQAFELVDMFPPSAGLSQLRPYDEDELFTGDSSDNDSTTTVDEIASSGSKTNSKPDKNIMVKIKDFLMGLAVVLLNGSKMAINTLVEYIKCGFINLKSQILDFTKTATDHVKYDDSNKLCEIQGNVDDLEGCCCLARSGSNHYVSNTKERCPHFLRVEWSGELDVGLMCHKVHASSRYFKELKRSVVGSKNMGALMVNDNEINKKRVNEFEALYLENSLMLVGGYYKHDGVTPGGSNIDKGLLRMCEQMGSGFIFSADGMVPTNETAQTMTRLWKASINDSIYSVNAVARQKKQMKLCSLDGREYPLGSMPKLLVSKTLSALDLAAINQSNKLNEIINIGQQHLEIVTKLASKKTNRHDIFVRYRNLAARIVDDSVLKSHVQVVNNNAIINVLTKPSKRRSKSIINDAVDYDELLSTAIVLSNTSGMKIGSDTIHKVGHIHDVLKVAETNGYNLNKFGDNVFEDINKVKQIMNDTTFYKYISHRLTYKQPKPRKVAFNDVVRVRIIGDIESVIKSDTQSEDERSPIEQAGIGAGPYMNRASEHKRKPTDQTDTQQQDEVYADETVVGELHEAETTTPSTTRTETVHGAKQLLEVDEQPNETMRQIPECVKYYKENGVPEEYWAATNEAPLWTKRGPTMALFKGHAGLRSDKLAKHATLQEDNSYLYSYDMFGFKGKVRMQFEKEKGKIKQHGWIAINAVDENFIVVIMPGEGNRKVYCSKPSGPIVNSNLEGKLYKALSMGGSIMGMLQNLIKTIYISLVNMITKVKCQAWSKLAFKQYGKTIVSRPSRYHSVKQEFKNNKWLNDLYHESNNKWHDDYNIYLQVGKGMGKDRWIHVELNDSKITVEVSVSAMWMALTPKDALICRMIKMYRRMGETEREYVQIDRETMRELSMDDGVIEIDSGGSVLDVYYKKMKQLFGSSENSEAHETMKLIRANPLYNMLKSDGLVSHNKRHVKLNANGEYEQYFETKFERLNGLNIISICIPSGAGKSTLCAKYPELFLDIDTLMRMEDFAAVETVKLNDGWDMVNKRYRERLWSYLVTNANNKKVLLCHGPEQVLGISNEIYITVPKWIGDKPFSKSNTESLMRAWKHRSQYKAQFPTLNKIALREPADHSEMEQMCLTIQQANGTSGTFVSDVLGHLESKLINNNSSGGYHSTFDATNVNKFVLPMEGHLTARTNYYSRPVLQQMTLIDREPEVNRLVANKQSNQLFNAITSRLYGINQLRKVDVSTDGYMDMLRRVCHDNFDEMCNEFMTDTISPDENDINAWLEIKGHKFEYLKTCYEYAMSKPHMFSSKLAKAHLKTENLMKENVDHIVDQLARVIVWHEQQVSMVLCPVINRAKERFKLLLNDNKMKYADGMSPLQINMALRKVKKTTNIVELDLSKQDRQTDRMLLDFEAELLLKLGVNDKCVKFLAEANDGYMIKTREKITAYRPGMRWTGGEMTSLGNEIRNCVLLGQIDSAMPFEFALTLGDDSIIFTNSEMDEKMVRKMGRDYHNVEVTYSIKNDTGIFLQHIIAWVDDKYCFCCNPLRLLERYSISENGINENLLAKASSYLNMLGHSTKTALVAEKIGCDEPSSNGISQNDALQAQSMYLDLTINQVSDIIDQLLHSMINPKFRKMGIMVWSERRYYSKFDMNNVAHNDTNRGWSYSNEYENLMAIKRQSHTNWPLLGQFAL